MIVEQVQAVASSSARVQSSGIHASPEAPVDLPSTSHLLHDGTLSPPLDQSSGCSQAGLESTASLRGRRLVLGTEEWLGDEHIPRIMRCWSKNCRGRTLVRQRRSGSCRRRQLNCCGWRGTGTTSKKRSGGIVRDHNGNEANFL